LIEACLDEGMEQGKYQTPKKEKLFQIMYVIHHHHRRQRG
jgi:hypothetical protein